MSKNELRRYIDEFNKNHPDMELVVERYNDYYHLKYKNGLRQITAARYPKDLFEKFCIWREGYYAGIDK